VSIAELQNNTEHFLRTNHVVIAGGGSASLPGPAYFRMEPRTGPGGGFMITKLRDRHDAPDIFEAWYIPMEQIGSFQANRLPTSQESSLRLMLTSQLTACLFAVGKDGNNTTVAHIQPDQNAHKTLSPQQAAAVRQSDMRMTARVRGMKTFMSHADPFDNFTKGYDYSRTGKGEAVAIVGVRDDAGKWGIFAQVCNKDKTVKDVHRI
jgi:hypothetical protein